jgi:hypothetical protein
LARGAIAKQTRFSGTAKDYFSGGQRAVSLRRLFRNGSSRMTAL